MGSTVTALRQAASEGDREGDSVCLTVPVVGPLSRSRAGLLQLVNTTLPQPKNPSMDAESRSWLADLNALGQRRDEAVDRLHELLLRAAHFEINRRRASLADRSADELADLAQQSANDALMAVLAKLESFRGDSRFTTWAFKFALLEAGVKLRRRAWQRHELPLTPEGWSVIADARAQPHQTVAVSELLGAVGTAIKQDLTDHQRDVLVAITLNGVPIDVLAERLDTTRGALYKTLHDARAKLRVSLGDNQAAIDSVLQVGADQ